MNVFKHNNYRTLISAWVEEQPRVRGQWKAIASHLRVNTSFISQVFKGSKNLSLEQALSLAQFMGLRAPEVQYFLLLIQFERAGTVELKRYFERELRNAVRSDQKVSTRIEKYSELPEHVQAVYYSQWLYTAASLLTSIPRMQVVDELFKYLKISRTRFEEILSFLTQHGLVVRDGATVKIGPTQTHLSNDSPLITIHHTNWRNAAIRSLDSKVDDHLHLSFPMTLSIQDFQIIRQELLTLISKVRKTMEPSPCETTACLNVDWFHW